jgi:hypothetical protein
MFKSFFQPLGSTFGINLWERLNQKDRYFAPLFSKVDFQKWIKWIGLDKNFCSLLILIIVYVKP